ncbi:hypothetical protein MRS44_013414 [Fusarium solani]|uniref:uncharacterized protein n=1 Tax=Fusarium solani TaxID=169388 RepID=UPI0032C4AFB7|nr:hypothetical protein MRS44_013414 [Fusarium solani]
MDNVFKGEQANSWLNAEGECELASSIGGLGEVDFDNANRGNPAYTKVKPTKPERHMVNPSGNTRMTFQPQGKVNSRGDGGRFARSTYFKSGLTVDPGLFAALRLFEVPIFDRCALVV